jgi:hypothetical protein
MNPCGLARHPTISPHNPIMEVEVEVVVVVMVARRLEQF